MKKLKMWLYKKIFKDINKMHVEYQLQMKNILACKESEIKNLKNQINFLTMKGPLL